MLFNPFRTFRQRLTNSYRIPRRRKSRHSLKTPISSAVELLEQRLLLTCAVDGDGWASADGGCKDLRTGLVFSVDQAGISYTWNGAVDHAERSVEGGFDDWRLPTIDEFVSARENGFNDHNDVIFDTFRWSSETKKNRGIDSAYIFAFSTGEIRLSGKTGGKFVFNVRDSNPVAGP
jgi:hypothetical protein